MMFLYDATGHSAGAQAHADLCPRRFRQDHARERVAPADRPPRTHILGNLGAENRTQAVVRARELGLVE